MFFKILFFLFLLVLHSKPADAIVVKKGTVICSSMSGYVQMMNLNSRGFDREKILDKVSSCKENKKDVSPMSLQCQGLLYCKGRLRGEIYWFNRQNL